MRDASLTGGKLHRLSWRVDVTQSTRRVEEVGEVCAIIDMEVKPRRGEGEASTVRFEMGREQAAQVHFEVDRLRKAIAQATGGE